MTRLVPLRQLRHRIGPLAGASASQALSSLSNVIVAIAVGRGVGAAGLGRYALAFSAYLVVLAVSRALVSEPLLALRRQTRPDDPALNAAAGASALVGAGGGAVCILIGVGLQRPEIWIVGLFMVPLCVQDFLRFAFFRARRQWRAALLDAVWVLVSLGGFPVILSQRTPAVAAAMWGVGATIAAVPGLIVLRVRLARPTAVYRWWRLEARRLGVGLALESIALTIGSQASLWVIASALGNADLGLLRAAETILAPVTMVVSGFGVLVVPDMAQSSAQPSRSRALRISLQAVILTGVLAAALVWLGPPIARLLFGSVLEVEKTLLLPVGCHFAATPSRWGRSVH